MLNYNDYSILNANKIISVPSVQAVTMIGVNLYNMIILIDLREYWLYIGWIIKQAHPHFH